MAVIHFSDAISAAGDTLYFAELASQEHHFKHKLESEYFVVREWCETLSNQANFGSNCIAATLNLLSHMSCLPEQYIPSG